MQQVPGSHRPAPSAARVSDAPDDQPIQVTVVLKPGADLPARDAPALPLSHADFRARYASRPGAISAVANHATSHGLRVVEAAAATHVVRLAGSLASARSAFQPDALGLYRIDGRDVIARDGALHLPAAVAQHVVAALGLDQRPIARPRFRFHPNAAPAQPWLPAAVAARYGFPAGLDGTGQTIALIELGGGYDAAQVGAYFAATHVQRTGKLVAVGVSGGQNSPDGNMDGPDGEVQLDICVAGAVAPGATIATYFAPNAGNGFFDAIHAALHDQANNPSVISISWGSAECDWSGQEIAAFEQLFQSAAALGVTVLAASGDDGAADGVQDGRRHADYPASSPCVLGCGGTRLPRSGAPETAWNDGPGQGAGGGGFSALFPTPAWQKAAVAAYARGGVPSPHRGVPDVAGNADPETGFVVSVNGTETVCGGTSAVAPLWAGLLALANQKAGRRVGFVTPTLYAHPGAFSDVVTGGNNGFSAAAGWDAAAGLGSPKGAAVIAALAGAVAAS